MNFSFWKTFIQMSAYILKKTLSKHAKDEFFNQIAYDTCVLIQSQK